MPIATKVSPVSLETGVVVGQAEPKWDLTVLIRDQQSLPPLKPEQKLWAVKLVIIPKHQHSWVLGISMRGTLERRGALERSAKTHDTRVAGIAEALLSISDLTSKELHEAMAMHHKTQLYTSTDDRCLSGADESPLTHEWVDDGTILMRGSNYINAIKTHLRMINSRLRSLQDLGCGRSESLGHII
ncbi:hypothetical protein E2C01_003601 [Portunus trituberculatus]|uniref:Uncharacterized protein n=1 Tax=Portunus trituberculatus TaxID=210409 RepID=A0A5B7CRP7_PORTR|nr:hypothetical protein [Portunus trituberculatus]